MTIFNSTAVLLGQKALTTRITEKLVCNSASFLPQEFAGAEFADFAVVMLTTAMMKALNNAVTFEQSEATERLAGARILVMEKCFDALIDTMIADGSEPMNAAAVMLEHLARRFAGRGLAS